MDRQFIQSLHKAKPTEHFPSLQTIDYCFLFEQQLEMTRKKVHQRSVMNISNLKNNLQKILQKCHNIFEESDYNIQKAQTQIQKSFQPTPLQILKCQCSFETQSDICYKDHVNKQHGGVCRPGSSHIIKKNGQLISNLQKKQIKNTFDQFQDLLSFTDSVFIGQNRNRKKTHQESNEGIFLKSKTQKKIYQKCRTKQFLQKQFVCGCGKKFQKLRDMLLHLRQLHSNIVIEGTSHIFVRDKKKSTPMSLKIETQDEEQDEKYRCQCNGRLMKRKNFIKHVLEKHKGITPI